MEHRSDCHNCVCPYKYDNFMFENMKIRILCAGSSDKRVSKGDVTTINSLPSVSCVARKLCGSPESVSYIGLAAQISQIPTQ